MSRWGPDRRARVFVGVHTEIELLLPASRCRAAALSASTSCSSCAEPMCSIRRAPRRFEYTTCTAVAPDAVCTVRTYATIPDPTSQA
jgi:hypothetical protein